MRPSRHGSSSGRSLCGVALAIACALTACADRTDRGPGSGAGQLRVVFVADANETSLPAEENAALAWVRAQPSIRARFVQLIDLRAARLDADEVVWWHYETQPELPSAAMRPDVIEAVREHLAGGGRLLLTLFAAGWLVPLGLEEHGPDHIGFVDGTAFARWGPDDDRLLAGFQTYRGHPLLRRFWGGTYTLTPRPGRRYAVARYTGDQWPENGRVVAVAKRYIGIDTRERPIIEYPPAPGRPGTVLAIGQGMYFAEPTNRNRIHLELFTHDAIQYLLGGEPPAPTGASVRSTGAPTLPAASTMSAGESPAPAPPAVATSEEAESEPADLPAVLAARTYWTPRPNATRRFDPPIGSLPEAKEELALLEAISAARSGLALEGRANPASDFDLASPRTLATGTQTGLIEDVWVWPTRVLTDLRLGLRGDDGRVAWLADAAPAEFVARPEGDSWRYTLGDRTIETRLAVARQAGGLLLAIEIDSPRPETLVAAWAVDHAVPWPREADHFGVLEIGHDPGTGSVVWRDTRGRFEAWAGFGRVDAALVAPPGLDTPEPDLASGQEPAPAPGRAVVLDLPYPAGSPAVVFAVAAATSPDGARDAFLAMHADPVAVWTTNANYFREFLDDTLDLASPDPTFNDAMRWAKVGLDAFRATTPGLGTGLMAGYASSADPADDAWARDNDFLRRPGYGWYFGRDAVWTAFASDAYGGTDLTSEALRFLARYQDVDGKILHELSPSGVIHYDAADSTPLFLIGLEHHLRATGDRALLRDLWPSVRRAMAYLETTDTDNDGLIENTDVGHGWIEGGKFYGAHTTFYLAGLWASTLDAVANLASWIGDSEMAAASALRAGEVRRILDTEFWDDAGRAWYHGKRADGTFMAIRTIMPAVPMYLGLLEETRSRPLLDLFASAEITTDWGARIAERSNPDYDPRGYHHGMVWPLFSGWTSLAAYAHHRPLSAWSHLNSNVRLYRHGNLGYMPETLDGDRFDSAGVTTHQAWSEAMVLLPAIEGLAGIRADALGGRLRVHPHLPGGWGELVVGPVRVGDDAFRIRIVRGLESSGFELTRLSGSNPIQIELSLPFPRSVLVNLDRDATTGVAILDGETIIDHPSEKEASVVATMTEASATVMFRHSPFPEVIPPALTLEPSARSVGLRLLDATYRGSSLVLRVEGIPGRNYRLNLSTPWRVDRVSGRLTAAAVAPGPGRATIELVLPGSAEGYQRADLTVEFRR